MPNATEHVNEERATRDLVRPSPDKCASGAIDGKRCPSSLTTAELGVLHFLPTDLSLAEIAQHPHVSRNTTRCDAVIAYRKLGVSSRSDAVTVAREAGLLPR